MQGCIQKSCQGGGKFGVHTKEGGQIWGTYKRGGGGGGGGGKAYEVLHPILARGGENDTRGANAPPPLKYSPGM